MTAKPFSLNLTNLLLLAVLFAVSLSVGVADFRWSDVFSLSDSQQVMFISRLPRTFAIVLTGASMAVAGMIMQILMRNRFVEPSMAGAGQSAALGLLLMSLLLPAAPLPVKMSVAAVAAVAALIGMLVFMLLIRRLPPTAQLMVPLVGIIFGGVVEAVATFIAYENEMLQMLGVWQQGDFSSVLLGRYELLWITGGLAVFAYLIADRLTILGLGETVSVNLGLNRTAVLWSGLIIVALITSLVIVTVGNIPFIGLVVPNIISRLIGDRLRQSLPAVALLGASLVLLCDIIGRVIVFPFEIPVSTVFGVLGTALFLWLLLRKPAHAV
ncbi:TPA: ABC transporter permease [Neisseria meningitidis]